MQHHPATLSRADTTVHFDSSPEWLLGLPDPRCCQVLAVLYCAMKCLLPPSCYIPSLTLMLVKVCHDTLIKLTTNDLPEGQPHCNPVTDKTCAQPNSSLSSCPLPLWCCRSVFDRSESGCKDGLRPRGYQTAIRDKHDSNPVPNLLCAPRITISPPFLVLPSF